MKNLKGLLFGFFAIGILSTSCTKMGCPSVQQEYQFDKEIKTSELTVAIVDIDRCKL